MSRAGWPRVKLAGLVDLVSGFPFKSGGFTAALDDIPLVKGENVHQGYIDWNKAKRWPRDQDDGMEKYWLKPGDVILAMDRPWIEAGLKQACIRKHDPPSLLVQRVSRLRGLDGLLTDYLRHLIGSPSFTDYIKPIVTGINVPHISGAQIKGFEFPLPPLPVQRRVASILSAYDDLIENNTRRIAILEEMARRIYEEWFVRFRFPGHEGVRMVESELGLMPEGWRTATVGEVAAYINRGIAPKYDDTAACLVVNQKCIRDQRLSLGEARKQSKPVPLDKAIRLGDVLINSTGVGTLGRVAQVLVPIDNCTVDTHVSIVRPGRDCDPDYFGLTLLAQQTHFEAQGVGSTGQTELSRGRIAETSIVVPPLAVQRAFAEIVRPMRHLTVTLQNKSLNLRTTRDFLLPKLICGELDVSTLPEPEALAA